MKRFDFNVQPREGVGKGAARESRRRGFIPAVVYGAGRDNELVAVDEKQLRSALRAGAAKSLVTLKAAGGDTLAIVKETQFDALGDRLEHVDFQRVLPDQPIHVAVPLVTTGKARGEAFGGILEHLVRDVRVKCLPLEIPDQLTIDIGPLGVGEGFHLRDLTPPPGVTFLEPPETALVVLKASRMARAATAEETAAEEAAASAAAAAAEAEAEETKAAPGKGAAKGGEGKTAGPKKEK